QQPNQEKNLMALISILCAFALVSVTLSQARGFCNLYGFILFLQVSSLSTKDKYDLTWLLYQLTQIHHNGIDAHVPPRRPEGAGKLESRREALPVELLQGPSLGSRIRKAGCKVFFWKSWTAC
uniref:Somatostatin/Cortistatin C-terminal domain-containing protein n=1 Tax=Esox lucius TaxID=8010 RepID=A0A3P9A6L1_ESOLU